MQDVKDLIFKTMEQVEAAELEPIKALVILHRVQQEADAISKQIKAWKSENLNELESDASEYPDGYAGFTFEFRSGGGTLVYKGIPEWDEAEKKKKELEAKYKAAYNSLQKGMAPVDAETGEVLKVPYLKPRAGSVVLKAKR